MQRPGRALPTEAHRKPALPATAQAIPAQCGKHLSAPCQQQTTCAKCGGTGKTVRNPCPTCRGKGKVRKNKKISVKIPAGVDNGQAVRVSRRGFCGF